MEVGRLVDTLEQFRKMLYTRSMVGNGRSIADAIMRVEPEHQHQALEELLDWFELHWKAEGAEEALRSLPPSLTFQHDGHAETHNRVQFPFGDASPGTRPPYPIPEGFWERQQRFANSVNDRFLAARPAARSRWLDMCRRSKQWHAAVRRQLPLYNWLVAYELEALPRPGWQGTDHWERASAARRGEPNCEHVGRIRQCEGCDLSSKQAFEAHNGWAAPRLLKDLNIPQQVHAIGPCPCCGAAHRPPVPKRPGCRYCAEALYWHHTHLESRRFGGWDWVRWMLMADTEATFRADPVNAEREIRVAMRPLELHEQVEQYYARVRRLGTDPWRADSHVEWSLGLERMATMIVPVPILRTDLKADVEERATRIISELWKRLGLKTPRSRGTSTTRTKNWDAYLDWLWQHRVQRRPIPEIRAGSSWHGDDDPSPNTIREGITRALESLR